MNVYLEEVLLELLFNDSCLRLLNEITTQREEI